MARYFDVQVRTDLNIGFRSDHYVCRQVTYGGCVSKDQKNRRRSRLGIFDPYLQMYYVLCIPGCF